MTNPLSTPEPAVDGAACDQKQREYARRAEEIRAAADPEDDNARGLLIQHERETEERNR